MRLGATCGLRHLLGGLECVICDKGDHGICLSKLMKLERQKTENFTEIGLHLSGLEER